MVGTNAFRRSISVFCRSCFGRRVCCAFGRRALHIDRHEAAGDQVRFYIGDSVGEISAAKIARFEADDYAPASTAAPTPAAAPPAAPPQPVAPCRARLPNWPIVSPINMVCRAGWYVASMKNESGFSPNAISPKGYHRPDATHAWHRAKPWAPIPPTRAERRCRRTATCAICCRNTMAACGTRWPRTAGPGCRQIPRRSAYAETVRYINRIEQDRKKAERQP